MAGNEAREIARGKIKLRGLVRDYKWVYAKTQPKWPHSYVMRKFVPDSLFLDVVRFIRKFGYDSKFGATTIRYVDLDGMRFWTMGDLEEGTILINTAKNFRPDYPFYKNPKKFKPTKGAGGSGWGHARNYRGFCS